MINTLTLTRPGAQTRAPSAGRPATRDPSRSCIVVPQPHSQNGRNHRRQSAGSIRGKADSITQRFVRHHRIQMSVRRDLQGVREEREGGQERGQEGVGASATTSIPPQTTSDFTKVPKRCLSSQRPPAPRHRSPPKCGFLAPLGSYVVRSARRGNAGKGGQSGHFFTGTGADASRSNTGGKVHMINTLTHRSGTHRSVGPDA
jgi:hypothetical protein